MAIARKNSFDVEKKGPPSFLDQPFFVEPTVTGILLFFEDYLHHCLKHNLYDYNLHISRHLQ